jgi:hypothetical protein
MKIRDIITVPVEPVPDQDAVFHKRQSLMGAQDSEIQGLQRQAKLASATAAKARAQAADIRSRRARERANKAAVKVSQVLSEIRNRSRDLSGGDCA